MRGPSARAFAAWLRRRRAGLDVFTDPANVLAVNAAVVLALSVAFLVRLRLLGDWLVPPHPGRGHAVDFAAFWASGKVVGEGRAAQAYDWSQLRAVLERTWNVPVPHGLPVYYPPPFLMLTAPLGALPYGPAFALWAAAGLAAFVAVASLAGRRPAAMIAALAGVGVFASLRVGQTGLFVAAALGAGLSLAERRPLAGGALLGLLCCKPQFAPLAAIALLAAGRWTAAAAAFASAATLALLAGLVFGWEVYPAFFAAASRAAHSFATTGWLSWGKVQTVYGGLRQAGAPAGWAFAAWAAVAAAAALAVAGMWRAGARPRLRVAAAAAGTYLSTPYAFSYDAALLALATAFILADADAERPLTWPQMVALEAAFVAPFLAIPWPTIAPSAAVLLAVAARRAWPRTRITEISRQASHPCATVEASS